jgi:hypothetical protein
LKVSDSVRRAIDEWEEDEFESAMLHTCNAVDGTAKKAYPTLSPNARFVKLLRDGYPILGPMGFLNLNIYDTRFPVRTRVTATPGSDGRRLPDAADLIYGVHRTTHGHGDELPDGFDLLRDAHVVGPVTSTRMKIEKGKVRLSDRVIFGMLGVAVLEPVNVGQTIQQPVDYKLYFGGFELVINDWWGRREDFMRDVVERHKFLEGVTMQFADWGDAL